MRLARSREERRVVLLVHAAAPVEVRDDHARVDGVDAHALRRELERRAPRQLIDGRLAHAVGEDAGNARRPVTLDTLTICPRDAESAGRQPRASGERRPGVDVHHRVPLAVGRRLDRAGPDDPRGVDHRRQSAETLDRRADDAPQAPTLQSHPTGSTAARPPSFSMDAATSA